MHSSSITIPTHWILRVAFLSRVPACSAVPHIIQFRAVSRCMEKNKDRECWARSRRVHFLHDVRRAACWARAAIRVIALGGDKPKGACSVCECEFARVRDGGHFGRLTTLNQPQPVIWRRLFIPEMPSVRPASLPAFNCNRAQPTDDLCVAKWKRLLSFGRRVCVHPWYANLSSCVHAADAHPQFQLCTRAHRDNLLYVSHEYWFHGERGLKRQLMSSWIMHRVHYQAPVFLLERGIW